MDGAVADFKPSCLRSLDRADALVMTSDAALEWPEVPQSLLRRVARFRAPAPGYGSVELLEAIQTEALQKRLAAAD